MSEVAPCAAYRIGVISDTHGELPDAVEIAFEGVDAIVHAGDVGTGFVLDLLGAIAPTTAVSGNADYAEGPSMPLVANVRLGGVRVVVAHRERDLAGSLDPVRAGARIAIFGHTHVPSLEMRDGVLRVNPGSATQPREGSVGSVAIVTVAENGSVSGEIVPLAD